MWSSTPTSAACVAAALAVAAGEAEPGDGREPFLELAVEAVLAVAGEKLQQAHDQRPGKAQQRGGEGHAHAAELASSPLISRSKTSTPPSPSCGASARIVSTIAGNGGGEAVEGAQKAEEDQQVADVAGDVARLVDAGRHGIEDRARGRRAESASARRATAAARRAAPEAAARASSGGRARSAAKPSIQLTELISWSDLPEAGHDAEHEDEADEPFSQGLARKTGATRGKAT